MPTLALGKCSNTRELSFASRFGCSYCTRSRFFSLISLIREGSHLGSNFLSMVFRSILILGPNIMKFAGITGSNFFHSHWPAFCSLFLKIYWKSSESESRLKIEMRPVLEVTINKVRSILKFSFDELKAKSLKFRSTISIFV